MTTPKVAAALDDAASAASSAKPNIYSSLLRDVLNKSTGTNADYAADIIAYVDSLLSSSLGIITTRPLLTNLIHILKVAPAEVKIQAGLHIVDVLTASYEEQDAMVREILANGYEAEEEYTNAAKALQGIQLDSTQRDVTVSYTHL